MHFAAFIRVEESVAQPGKYFRNNFCNTLNLLEAMVRHGVRRFIFSSTAAVYGEPQYVPVDEKHPREPINPYGASKRMVEDALLYYAAAYGLQSVPLRYFNAAGADPQARLGPRHNPLTHLIPLVLRAAAGVNPNIKVFGRDYPTPDGTAHPRLHPRDRSVRSASRGDRLPRERRRDARVQSRRGPRLQRAGSDRRRRGA